MKGQKGSQKNNFKNNNYNCYNFINYEIERKNIKFWGL